MPSPIRILILDNTFTFGGAIKSLSYLLRALDQTAFCPVLVSGQPEEYLSRNFQCIWHRQLPKLPWVDNNLFKRIISLKAFQVPLFRKAINISRFIYWIFIITFPETISYVRLGRQHRIQIIHLNNMFATQLAGILAAKLLRVPCIAQMRDFEENHPITRLYARMVDHHLAISNAVYDNLKMLGVPEHKITMVHDSVEVSERFFCVDHSNILKEFGITQEQPTFGIFGRILEWKGIREFILASLLVLEHFPTARGFIVGSQSDGDNTFSASMVQLAADLQLEHKVIFTGYREDVLALMEAMSVVVHASIRPEPFGMVVIEGMAMKKPIVATKGGGPVEIVVDGKTGYLVKMGDSQSMGNAIVKLLRNHSLRRKMGDAGRDRVYRHFNSKQAAFLTSCVYLRIKRQSNQQFHLYRRKLN